MSGKIFVLQDGEKLVDMTEEAYGREVELQKLIADYPDLLAGDQIDSDSPRKWLLVKREMDVPDAQDGSGRWALDHLFLDQEGVPTLVEVKRRTDTRIRREVIGQMLDYAANGVAYWPVTTLRENFAKTWKDKADQKLAEFLGIEADTEDSDETEVDINPAVEEFWQNVGTNLKVGKLRLLFVADEFPKEILRVIEFLNDNMPSIQVLAVEIKQFVSQKGTEPQTKALVPRVIGQTEKRTAQKNASVVGSSGRRWNEVSFFENMEVSQSIEAVNTARVILKWVATCKLDLDWGNGEKHGSFTPSLLHNTKKHKLFCVYSNGNFETYFPSLKQNPPFDALNKRIELLHGLRDIPGVDLSDDAIDKSNKIKLTVFEDIVNTNALLKVMDCVIEEIKATK